MPCWIPLECNPEVFNGWANKAGLAPSAAQFNDVYGLDPESLSMVPRPIKAVLLVFPYGEALARRKADDECIANEGGSNVEGTAFWMKQTIGGACGAIALIHAIANSDVTLTPESPLQQFIHECRDKSPLDRGRLLETDLLLGDIHASVANKGQSSVPPAGVKVDQAYACFVVAPGEKNMGTSSTEQRIFELDGTRAGPVDRGVCIDLLEDVARIVREDFIKNSDSVKFSLMYLGQPM